MADTLKEWALKYADMGLAVFPLLPRDKRPATDNGFKAATTDKRRIEKWWNSRPDSNIGIATGSVSGGLVVIDLDVDDDKGKNGYDVLKIWQQEHGELPETCQSITGRGGYHLLYRDTAYWQSKVNLYDGVDIRAEGGYIVAPPSIHPNGRKYEWEYEPGEYEIAQADSNVFEFLNPAPVASNHNNFKTPKDIPEGSRNKTLHNLACSMRARGDAEEAIYAAVRATNASRCNPPLNDKEIETIVKSALKYESGTAPFKNSHNNEKVTEKVTIKDTSTVSVNEIEEKEVEWLIIGYVPKGDITVIAGDGGSGKTSVWCALLASLSSGNMSFLESDLPFNKFSGKKVMFFSSEDSVEHVLKSRLRRNGANTENISFIPVSDDRFKEIKFDSEFLEKIIKENRPEVIVFDPIQSFISEKVQMGQRNAMRSSLNPLIGLGEKYGVTFIIIVHANKQSGVWGRKRIADSSDIWDISRSVLMVGETGEGDIRYISQEKSNYGPLSETVLFTTSGGKITFKGYTTKKDRDFVLSNDYATKQKPVKESTIEFILDFLKDGEKEIAELDEMAKAMSISDHSLKAAKADLRKSGKIKTWSVGYGSGKKYFISLTGTSKTVQ